MKPWVAQLKNNTEYGKAWYAINKNGVPSVFKPDRDGWIQALAFACETTVDKLKPRVKYTVKVVVTDCRIGYSWRNGTPAPQPNAVLGLPKLDKKTTK